ncbi:hypothetical protein ZIOFF_066990 [Zingiber officinale]|uniref:BTB domain-containing protein n=1 Tax=Zingiber officinale TaxID=94328 RepID=A0A8J5BJ34_ZINOF|nr:hypothetical protein ZIOFF_066990 [Zingiber officinale]
MEPGSPWPSSQVFLNVGGKKYTTTIDTLTQREPDSMLAAMFSGRYTVSTDDKTVFLMLYYALCLQGMIFIDRDGKHFRHILNWLRDGIIPMLQDSDYQELIREAEYYQLLVSDDGLSILSALTLEASMKFCILTLQGLIENINANLCNRKDKDAPVVELTELTRKEVIQIIQSEKVRFRGVNLSGLDLSKLDLSYVDFSYACIQKTNFSRANLNKAKFGDAEAGGSIFEDANLRECELIGADLHQAKLDRANLQSANLQDACLTQCSLCDADLRSAHLQSAKLSGANLQGANLEGANLKGAKLNSANLQDANLQRAYLREVDLRDSVSFLFPVSFHSTYRNVTDGLKFCNLRELRWEALIFLELSDDRATEDLLRGIRVIVREETTNRPEASRRPAKMEPGTPRPPSQVFLNVGGKKYATTIDTLTQREPDSMLATIFSGQHTVFTDDKTGMIFIDRDGKHFRHILNWLRDGIIPMLQDSDYQELIREAEYYQLLVSDDGLSGLVENINASMCNRKDEDTPVVELTELTRKEVIQIIQSEKVRFRGVNLSGLDLSKLDLSYVDFSYACIQKTNFSRANLNKAKFGDAEAGGSIFEDANLRE